MPETYDHPHDPYFDATLSRPTARVWARHLIYLAITFCTATIAGSVFPFGPIYTFPAAELPIWNDAARFIAWAPTIYSFFVVYVVYGLLSDMRLLIDAISFSGPLLFVLICHEMGHYVACRIYRVDSTLPYFIPTPPMVGPAGTFGAFIRIKSRIPTRRAVFDIGVAGPIAGFVALLPFAVLGVATMQPVPADTQIPPGVMVFSDPLLIRGIAAALGKNVEFAIGGPFYWVAWMGALVTALNLIPSGQLDGGHAVYAALGRRIHYLLGRVAFVIMAALSVLGMLIYGSPSGFLIAVLLGVMMKIPHPEPWDNTPLDKKRKVIAVLTLLIFLLCFVPFPITFT